MSAERADPEVPGPGAGNAAGPGSTRTLRFEPGPVPGPEDGTTVVVLDTGWTPAATDASPSVLSLRDVAERVMAGRDLFAEAAGLLDGWAEATGVVGLQAVDGVSFWYGARLGEWMWLVDHLLWLAVVDDLLATVPAVGVIACAPGTDDGLVEAARLIGARDGLVVHGGDGAAPAATTAEDPAESAGPEDPATGDASRATPPAVRPDPDATPAPAAGAPQATSGAPKSGRRSLVDRLRWRYRPPEPERRRRLVAARLADLERDPVRRLLVVQAHRRQRIDTPAGPRSINPYLGPIIDRLRGGPARPVRGRHPVVDDGRRGVGAAARP